MLCLDRNHQSPDLSGLAGPFDGGGTDRRSGWVAGGGGEYTFARNWSVKTEYAYYDFGDLTSTPDAGGVLHLPTVKYSELRAQTAKLGVNYRFDWGGLRLGR